jgi:mono/diheme cytochrome c family protein
MMTAAVEAAPERTTRARHRCRRSAVAIALAVAVAGCGATGPGPNTGSALFKTHCETCHSISGHSAPRQQGGDLKNLHLPRVELVQLTAEMPPIHGRLSAREVRAVVEYLQAVER